MLSSLNISRLSSSVRQSFILDRRDWTLSYVDAGRLHMNDELRAKAREQLRGNWGKAVLVCFLYCLIAVVLSSIPYVGELALMAITGALMLGLSQFFVHLPRGEPAEASELFSRFSQWIPAFLLYLVTSLFVLLWSLLLIVPGIIAALRYSQVYFIMNDQPGIGFMDAIRQSSEMMQGQKGKLFMLYLSFIGWLLLCIVTLGIGLLWLYPYMMATFANFYEDLKQAFRSDPDAGSGGQSFGA